MLQTCMQVNQQIFVVFINRRHTDLPLEVAGPEAPGGFAEPTERRESSAEGLEKTRGLRSGQMAEGSEFVAFFGRFFKRTLKSVLEFFKCFFFWRGFYCKGFS